MMRRFETHREAKQFGLKIQEFVDIDELKAAYEANLTVDSSSPSFELFLEFQEHICEIDGSLYYFY